MQPQAPEMQQPELKSVATALEWRGIGIFLLATFGLTWAVWAVVYLLGGAENLPLLTVGSLVAMWCPGIAAIICSRYITPMSKRDLGLQRGYLERYVSIYFFVFLFLIAAMGLSVGLGFQEVNATLEPLSSEIADQQYPFNDPILAVFISIISSFTLAALFNSMFTLGEELGWRGYLLAKLAPIGLGRASILIGIIWGVWHAPAIFMGLNYPGHPFLGVLMMIWFTIGWSVISDLAAPSDAERPIRSIRSRPHQRSRQPAAASLAGYRFAHPRAARHHRARAAQPTRTSRLWVAAAARARGPRRLALNPHVALPA